MKLVPFKVLVCVKTMDNLKLELLLLMKNT